GRWRGHPGRHLPGTSFDHQLRELLGREVVQAVAPQDMDACVLAEQPRNRGVAHIQPAGIGAEGGQDPAPALADAATPAQAPAGPVQARLGMEMARDFRDPRWRGDMTEGEGSEDELRLGKPTQLRGRRGVVIARDPDPAPAFHELSQMRAVPPPETLRALAV